MNLAHNFGEGEAKSGGNSEILKVQFFFNFVANFWDRGGISHQQSVKECCNVSGTNWRNSVSKPREIWVFPHFSPIFPPAPPKNWALPPS